MDFLLGLYTYYAAGLGVYMIPVAAVDVDRWHLEARYNYEDIRTASLWAGPNVEWTGDVPGSVTPLGGLVFGNTNGIALGLESEITWNILTFYAEAEHVVDLQDRVNDYTYLWAEFSATLWERVDLGLTAQRLRPIKEAVETSPGIFLGTSVDIVTARIYAFNIAQADEFFMLSVDVEW